MKEKCFKHGQPLVWMCLQCEPTFFCDWCDQTHHHENHSELIDISGDDTEWLRYYEAKYEKFINLSASLLDQSYMIAYNEKMINTIIEKMILQLEEKRSLLLKDIDSQTIKEQLDGLREKLLNINFKADDLSELAKKVQHFQLEISPETEKTLQSVQENIKKWKIDPFRVSRIEKLLEEHITESLSLDNIFTNNELKCFKKIRTAQKGDEFFYEMIEEGLQYTELLQLEITWENKEQFEKKISELNISRLQRDQLLKKMENQKVIFEFEIEELKNKLKDFEEKYAHNSCYGFNSFRTDEMQILHDSKKGAKKLFQNQSNIKSSSNFRINDIYSSLDNKNKADLKPAVLVIDQLGFPLNISDQNINTYLGFSTSNTHQTPEFCIAQQPAQEEQSFARESISTIGKYSSQAYVSPAFETFLWQIIQKQYTRSQAVEKVSPMKSIVNLFHSVPYFIDRRSSP